MRCVLACLAIGFLVCSTFGCSSDDGEPVADASGQTASSAAAAGAAGMAPIGDPGSAGMAPGGASDPAMMPGGPGDSGAAGIPDAASMPDAATMPDSATMPGAAGMPGVSGPPGGMPGPPAGYGAAGAAGAGGPPPGMVLPGYAGNSSAGGPADSSAAAAIPAGVYPGGSYPPGGIPGPAMPGDSSAVGIADSATMPDAATNPGPAGYAVPGSVVPGYAGTPGVPGQPGVPGGQPVAPTTYDGFADVAFRQGRERDGMHYLQAWAVTSDKGASEVLSGIQWVPGLRRPAMAVRWGVGIQLTAPRNFNGDAKPIGSQQQFGTGRRGGDAGGSGAAPGYVGSADAGVAMPGSMPGSGGFGGMPGVSNENINKFAGEFGGKFLEQFQSRVSSGKFGKALQRASSGPAVSAPGGYAGADASSGAAGIPGGIPGAAGAPGYGGAMPGMPGVPGGFGAAGGGAAGEGRITTGLTFIGIGSDKELKEKAIKEQVDVLALFRIKITVNRAGLINNDAELILVDPVKNREIFNSSTLNNIKVQKDREQNKEDSVEKEINKIFAVVDKELVMTELPAALTPEIVKANRVEKQLLAGPVDDPLAVLTEIRFYHRGKLLSDEDTLASMAKVAGAPAAKTLMEGSEEDRKKVVEKWLPQS